MFKEGRRREVGGQGELRRLPATYRYPALWDFSQGLQKGGLEQPYQSDQTEPGGFCREEVISLQSSSAQAEAHVPLVRTGD